MNWSCVDSMTLCFQKAAIQYFDGKGSLEISWRDIKWWPASSESTDPAQLQQPWARRGVAKYFCNHIHNLQGLSRPSMMLCQEQDVVRACTDYLVSASGDFVRQTGDTVSDRGLAIARPYRRRSDAWQLCQTSTLFHLRRIWSNIPEISTILGFIDCFIKAEWMNMHYASRGIPIISVSVEAKDPKARGHQNE